MLRQHRSGVFDRIDGDREADASRRENVSRLAIAVGENDLDLR
jgi:hypothetical protein